jgi:hypothetical protein
MAKGKQASKGTLAVREIMTAIGKDKVLSTELSELVKEIEAKVKPKLGKDFPKEFPEPEEGKPSKLYTLVGNERRRMNPEAVRTRSPKVETPQEATLTDLKTAMALCAKLKMKPHELQQLVNTVVEDFGDVGKLADCLDTLAQLQS